MPATQHNNAIEKQRCVQTHDNKKYPYYGSAAVLRNNIYIYISATVPAGHQGSVSNEKTGYQLPVADYQLPVADYQLLLRHPLGASPGGIADFLNSFKGPHGPVSGLTGFACVKILALFFACFAILIFFTFSTRKGSTKW